MINSTSLSIEDSHALHLLAKRLNKCYKFITSSHWVDCHNNKVFCLICHEEVSFFPLDFARHGKEHLKEYGLLAFL